MDTDNYLATSGKNLLIKVGFDRAVGFAIFGNLASFIIGPITAYLITVFFTPSLQGYYYTFGSLISLQFLVELGLGQAVIQFASHEWSNLKLEDGRIVGNSRSRSRLADLGRITFKWYGITAIVAVGVLMPLGYLFFSSSSTDGINWLLPWIAYCLCVSINFLLHPIFFLLQGSNQVNEYWFYRAVQQVLNGVTIWFAIILGAGLWAAPAASLAGIAWSFVFLIIYYRKYVASLFGISLTERISWWSELWPLQWRIAVSWLSTYFVSFTFTPILFRLSGPAAAGQMGLAVALNSVLIAISTNWVITKAPRFGILIAQKKYGDLDSMFFRALGMSMLVVCAGGATIWLGVLFLNLLQYPISQRFLSPLPLGIFLLGTALNSVTLNFSIYLRAHKREPLVGMYFVGSFLIVTLAIIAGTSWGELGIVLVYLGVVATIQLPYATVVFFRSRARWHSDVSLAAV